MREGLQIRDRKNERSQGERKKYLPETQKTRVDKLAKKAKEEKLSKVRG